MKDVIPLISKSIFIVLVSSVIFPLEIGFWILLLKSCCFLWILKVEIWIVPLYNFEPPEKASKGLNDKLDGSTFSLNFSIKVALSQFNVKLTESIHLYFLKNVSV